MAIPESTDLKTIQRLFLQVAEAHGFKKERGQEFTLTRGDVRAVIYLNYLYMGRAYNPYFYIDDIGLDSVRKQFPGNRSVGLLFGDLRADLMGSIRSTFDPEMPHSDEERTRIYDEMVSKFLEYFDSIESVIHLRFLAYHKAAPLCPTFLFPYRCYLGWEDGMYNRFDTDGNLIVYNLPPDLPWQTPQPLPPPPPRISNEDLAQRLSDVTGTRIQVISMNQNQENDSD